MKISNFELIEKNRVEVEENIYKYYFIASVTVVSGWLLFKKVEQKKIYLEPWSSSWRWIDSGEYTPSEDVERLVSAFKAKNRKYLLSECI